MYRAIGNELRRVQLLIEQTENLIQYNNDFNSETTQALEYELAEMRARIDKLSIIKYWLMADTTLTDRINETIEELEAQEEVNENNI